MSQERTLWEPSEEVVARARVTAYRRWLAERGGPGPAGETYGDLWQWSVTEIDAFWDSIWTYFDVVGTRGDGPVREGGPMPVDGLRWFPGATVNYAANALRGAEERPDDVAVVFRSEAGGHRTLSRREIALHVAHIRAGLKELGVGRGDRVVAYLPNIPEALICFLAAASLGAVWSSCSPDFGASSVIDRFSQIEPKVLIAVDGYAYNGRRFDRRDTVAEIERALPTLAATVLVPYLDPAAGTDGLAKGVAYADLPRPGHDLEFADVPFDHPLWVVYSSGTTGLPKPIVHGHGGIVLEHLKALSFHQDLGPGDVFLWYTTTGWMMWNYLVGGLLVGATVVMYDGAPGGDVLWRLAAEAGVTYFGVGAPYIMASRKAGMRPGAEHDLSALRGIGSTGSPLPPEGFDWVYEAVGSDVLLGSFSGGTDVCTGFVGPSPLLPLRPGVIQCRGLGAKVESYDEDGKPVIDQVGELVLTEPMPSMPVFFWNDPDGERYRESYFEGFPGVWRHGDWIKILPDGGSVIYGRSDSTLNRGGVRMGTADFYRVVEAFEEVADSLVIDTGRLGEEGRLLLYVQLAPGAALDDDLAGRIRGALRSALSPRHVPDEILEVPGVPRTLSGKKLEIPVRRILLGTPVDKAANRGSMANPEVLEHYRPLRPA
ncbi:MAG TPA: acetoacetate--CoA ligase [Thermomonospora sp.]|nr:acetoacetate--CoA ligase [Thermomonospora sp.]